MFIQPGLHGHICISLQFFGGGGGREPKQTQPYLKIGAEQGVIGLSEYQDVRSGRACQHLGFWSVRGIAGGIDAPGNCFLYFCW